MPTRGRRSACADLGIVADARVHGPRATSHGILPRRRALGALLAAGGTLAGCSLDPDADWHGADAPAALPLPRPVRTAWVFSSGGPRGFVHVGVVKALSEMGLKPDLLVGASVGALVSVLCSAGLSGSAIERLALQVQPLSLLRLAGPGVAERFAGGAVADLVRAQLRGRDLPTRLQSLPVPVACVAWNVDERRLASFTHGDAGAAVQASAAVEGQFAPVRIGGRRYVDADLHQPLPVRAARALGAARVLAIDASAHEDRAPAGSERYRDGDRRKRELTRPDAAAADVLLHPDFGYWVSLSQEFRERAIDAGYRTALAARSRLEALHAG